MADALVEHMRVLVGHLGDHVAKYWGVEHPRSFDRATDVGCFNFDVPMRKLLNGAEADSFRDDDLVEILNRAFRKHRYQNRFTGVDSVSYGMASVGNCSIDVAAQHDMQGGKAEASLWLHTNRPHEVARDFEAMGQTAIRMAKAQARGDDGDSLSVERQLRKERLRVEKRTRRIYGGSGGMER